MICHRILGLNWFGSKCKVGFPEKNFEKYCAKLVAHGHKVAIVEQTETVKEKKQRIVVEKQHGRLTKSQKCLKRDLVQVMTKGTFFDHLQMSYEQKFIMCI